MSAPLHALDEVRVRARQRCLPEREELPERGLDAHDGAETECDLRLAEPDLGARPRRDLVADDARERAICLGRLRTCELEIGERRGRVDPARVHACGDVLRDGGARRHRPGEHALDERCRTRRVWTAPGSQRSTKVHSLDGASTRRWSALPSAPRIVVAAYVWTQRLTLPSGGTSALGITPRPARASNTQ